MASNTDNLCTAPLSAINASIDQVLIEDIFLFTFKDQESESSASSTNIMTSNPNAELYLGDVVGADSGLAKYDDIDEELLSYAVYERLMLTNPERYLISGESNEHALQTDSILYLHRAFVACEKARASLPPPRLNDCEKIHSIIVKNASMCMRQSDFYPGRPVWQQWKEIMENSKDNNATETKDFIAACIEKLCNDVDEFEVLHTLKINFYLLLESLQTEIASSNWDDVKENIFWVLKYFVNDKRVPQMGEVLIDYNMPDPDTDGDLYIDTLFGQIFSLSVLSQSQQLQVDNEYSGCSLRITIDQRTVFGVINQLLLQSPTTKQKTMEWFAKCLYANNARAYLWNNLNPEADNFSNQKAGDALMIGLTSVLLRLCLPLWNPHLKILSVDPTYCAVPASECQQKMVYMIKAFEETCLLPIEDNAAERPTGDRFNLMANLFYLTHKAYELSYGACCQRFIGLSQKMSDLQSLYQESPNTDPNSEVTRKKKKILKEQINLYLFLQNCLCEPSNDALILKFFESSAIWLTEVALTKQSEYEEIAKAELRDYAPQQRRNMQLPPNKIGFIPDTMRCVPEIIVNNLIAYLYYSRYCMGNFIQVCRSSHDALFTMIILFMGNPRLVKSPHLRAKLAESLELFVMKPKSGREFLCHVFDDHPDRSHVVRSLLNIFVSIEMTGQSVEFEQKFSYRRPMYAIMQYLWNKEEYVQHFRNLAIEAEENMEAIEPPLFLCFINLLINDAIFLLDEALMNLKQMLQFEEAHNHGEWLHLPASEHHGLLLMLHQMESLACFQNLLSRDTINVLKLITTVIQNIFCHTMLVDRVASMLNYFLLKLAGPQEEKFIVKSKKFFDPDKKVLEICHIYINLSSSDQFCLAVCKDCRSYTPQLFSYAENILGGLENEEELIEKISEFAEKVNKMDKQYKQEQEFLVNIPEEYLDPIMSTLMVDPVVLPGSKVNIDRSTICRHLLSDQSDPFSRAPLTMDKLIPNEALRKEIELWKMGNKMAD